MASVIVIAIKCDHWFSNTYKLFKHIHEWMYERLAIKFMFVQCHFIRQWIFRSFFLWRLRARPFFHTSHEFQRRYWICYEFRWFKSIFSRFFFYLNDWFDRNKAIGRNNKVEMKKITKSCPLFSTVSFMTFAPFLFISPHFCVNMIQRRSYLQQL